MANETARLEKLALKVINEHKLVFINEVASYMDTSRATFYNHGLDKLDTIKDALEQNRINVKKGLRKKWYESDNATTQIALYRLTSTDEELSKLNSQKVEHSGELKTGVTVHIVNAENPIPESESDVSGQ